MKILLFTSVGVVLLLLVVWLVLRLRARRESRKLTALVFLMSQPRALTEPQVREAITRVWGVELGSEMEQGRDWLVDAGVVNPAMAQPGARNFFVSVNDRMFLINSVSRPYMDDPGQFAESIPDMRLRRAVGGHTAWNSVDLFGDPPDETEREEMYGRLGRLLAEFAGDDCLAIYCPELERCNEYGPAVLEALQSGRPLPLFDEPTFAPVIQVEGTDPRMVAAVDEARRRWPEFVAAFEKRPNGSAEKVFAIKARFAEGDDEEFMWVSVQSIVGETITGRLENAPAILKSVREGSAVTVRLEDLNDWLYGGAGQPVGGFTMKVMTEIMKG